MSLTYTASLLICLFYFPSACFSQDSSHQSILQINGYIKDLNVIDFPRNTKPLIYENIIHNRFNVDWQSKQWKAGAALRNRIFWKNNQLRSSLERLWVEFRYDRWNIKAGRQRINWGMNNSWNPNDIFNTYNLFDFDYEERSGADAVKTQFRFSPNTSIELAWKANRLFKQNILAFKYNLHAGNYDWQLIGGVFNARATGGIGWQGSIGNTGFKGEIQGFSKDASHPARVNVGLEWDYISKKGWYWAGGVLFNQAGLHEHPLSWSTLNFNNTPDQLMPTRWNILFALRKEITPLITGSVHVLQAPSSGLWIIYPTGSFSLLNNLSLDLVWQGFWAHRQKGIITIRHTGFIRIKHSF